MNGGRPRLRPTLRAVVPMPPPTPPLPPPPPGPMEHWQPQSHSIFFVFNVSRVRAEVGGRALLHRAELRMLRQKAAADSAGTEQRLELYQVGGGGAGGAKGCYGGTGFGDGGFGDVGTMGILGTAEVRAGGCRGLGMLWVGVIRVASGSLGWLRGHWGGFGAAVFLCPPR